MARRKNPAVADEVARLREEYMEMIREGLGRDRLSEDEERDRLDLLEDEITSVFMLYARTRMAERLGITRWLTADFTGDMPETYTDTDSD